MIELLESTTPEAVIKVVGVGGCGGNAVDHMINNGVQGVEFISMNTDAQALKRNLAKTTLQLGTGTTKGLGAGANPEVGRLAAEEDRERIEVHFLVSDRDDRAHRSVGKVVRQQPGEPADAVAQRSSKRSAIGGNLSARRIHGCALDSHRAPHPRAGRLSRASRTGLHGV